MLHYCQWNADDRLGQWNDGPEFDQHLTDPWASHLVANRRVCSGGGKGGSSTTQNFSSGSSSTTIPPDVLARYNSVNQQAQTAAAQPFQDYSGEFVAPVNPTQQGGIDTITGAANSWSPYFGQATSTLGQGLGLAGQSLGAGQAAGVGLAGTSLGLTGQTAAQSQPYNTAAGGLFGSAYTGAQPYNTAASGLALAGTNAVNPSALTPGAIQSYESPYNTDVVNATVAQLRNQFGQQKQGLTGSQILNGTFGSDRGGVGQSVLANQQNLALGQTVSGLENQNYSQALGAAQQQQGVGLGAAQANRAALQTGAGQIQGIGQQIYGQGTGTGTAEQGLGNQVYSQGLGLANQYLNTGNTLFNQGNTAAGTQGGLATSGAAAYQGLGTGDLTNQLTQGQAAIGAGTVPQQTQQAQDTAQYNQFLQQQGYPFQVAQFLAGIAEGTGALSGSTTTSSGTSGGTSFQPQPFFSDERLKENVRVIGATRDGIPIVSYRYKGQPHTHIGMLAQDVEEKRPEAVGMDQGYKTVDYDAATRLHRLSNDDEPRGLVPARKARAAGGGSMDSLLALHQAMYPGSVNDRGIGAGPRGMQIAAPAAHSIIQGPKVDLPKVEYPKQPETTGLGSAIKGVSDIAGAGKGLASLYSGGKDALVGAAASGSAPATGGLVGSGGSFSNPGWIDRTFGGGSGAGSSGGAGPITSTPLPPPASAPAGGAGTPDASSPTGFSGGAPAISPPIAPPDVPVADAVDGGLGDIGDLGDLGDLAARGGRIRRRRASGGLLPYETGDGYVPEANSPDPTQLLSEQRGLAPPVATPSAQAPGGGGGGGGSSTFGDLLKIGMMAIPFLKRGGRATFAEGGVPEDPFKAQAAAIGRGQGTGDADPLAAGVNAQPETGGLAPPVSSGEVFDPAAEVRGDVAAEPSGGLAPAAAAALPARTAPTGGRPPGRAPQPTPDQRRAMEDRMLGAVATIESGSAHPDEGWGTVGPETRYPDGHVDRPYGKYGVMGDNVGPWTEQFYGRRLTPDEFKANRDAQTAVARGQLSDYVAQFGNPTKAFGAWFAGPKGIDSNAKDVLGTSVPWYMKRATALYNGEPDPGAQPPNGVSSFGPGNDPVGTALNAGRGSDDNVVQFPAGGARGLVPAGGVGPTGSLDPLTGRAAADPKAGVFDRGGFLDRNQREIATGLSFLGNMLASPSKTLAGSVGSGLAAAAPTYLAQGNREQEMGQQQQQIGQGQQRIDISNRQQLMSIWSQLLARRAGYVDQRQPVPPELNQMIGNIERQLSSSGAGPGSNPAPVRSGSPGSVPTPIGGGGGGGGPITGTPPIGGGGPITGTPLPPPATGAPPQTKAGDVTEGPTTAGTPATDENGLPTVTTTDRGFLSKIDPRYNPEEIAARAKELIGSNPELARQRFDEARAMSEKIAKEGGAPNTSGQFIYAPGGKERIEAEKRAGPNAELARTEGESAKARQMMRSNLQQLGHVLENYKTGGWAEAKAEFQSLAKGIGLDVPDTDSMSAAQFQKMMKDASAAIVSQGSQAGAHTDAFRDIIGHISPNPENQPEANKQLLAQMLGALDVQDKHGRDFAHDYQTNRYLDSPTWQQQWTARKENAPQNFIDQQYANLGVRGATPSLDRVKPNHVYVLEPGQEQSYNLPKGILQGPTKLRRVERDGKLGWEPVR